MANFPQQYTLFVILTPIVTFLLLGIIVYVWRYRKRWEISSLIWFLVIVAGWLVTNTAELVASSESQTLFWSKICYIFIAATPFFWLLFTFRYTGQEIESKPRRLIAYAAIPTTTVILALTNEAHHWLWQTHIFNPVGSWLAAHPVYGPWFWIHAIYSYLLILFSAILMIRQYLRSSHLYREQSLWLVIGTLIPILTNAVYVMNLIPQLQKDYTPISFALGGIAFSVGILRYRLFDLQPIAREVVLERMPDAVLAVDLQGRVVDLNPAAQQLVENTPETLIGQPLTRVIPAWETWAQTLQTRNDLQTDFLLEARGKRRAYEVHIFTLSDPRGKRTGWVLQLHDITERKEAEEAVQASEERYRQLVELSPEAIVVYRDGKIIFVNSATVTLMKADDTEDLLGKPILEFVHPDYRVQSRQRIKAALTTGTPAPLFEEKLICLDGTIVDVEVTTARLTYQGQTALQTIVRDITARRRAEAVLRLRLHLLEFTADHSLEELMQRALDKIGALTQSPVGFYHFFEADQQTLSLQAWSTRTLEEFCQAEGAEGQGLHYDLDDAGIWADAVRQRRPVIHNDYAALPHHKGFPEGHTPLTRELVVPTLREGRIVALLGVGNKPADYDEQDVDLISYAADLIWSVVERKRNEEQLQAYRRQLEAQNLELRKLTLAIEQSGNTIVMTDTDGAIEYVNPRFEETSGYSADEALGQNPHILKSGKQSPAYYRDLWQSITNGHIWRGEFHNQRKDGTLYWEAATIAPVSDADGDVTHYIAIKEDITKRKEAERALHSYAEQLASQNAELDAFAHTVAHDLKGPLSIVLGYGKLLEDSQSTTSPDVFEQAIRAILQSGEKMNTIIDELLLLAGVRKQEITPMPLIMAEIVKDACERLTSVIRATEADIVSPAPADWPVPLGYAPWVEEVWVNYISNALKYGGTPPRVELGWSIPAAEHGPAGHQQSTPSIKFWVRDNGLGLTAEAQAKLFTEFTRLDQARTKGHGLGLSIVRRIVEKLNGTVGVESEPGKGSCFYFTLPACAVPDDELDERPQG